MNSRNLTAALAAALIAFAGGQAGAQTAEDIAAGLPDDGWTTQPIGGGVVSCVAIHAGGSASGYEVRLADGSRSGELRFEVDGAVNVIAYDIGPGNGEVVDDLTVSRRHTNLMHRSLSLEEAAGRLDDPGDEITIVALEYLWDRTLCEGAPAEPDAAIEPGWNPVALDAGIAESVACLAEHGADDVAESGHYIRFANRSIVAALDGLYGEADNHVLYTVEVDGTSHAMGGFAGSVSSRSWTTAGGMNFPTPDDIERPAEVEAKMVLLDGAIGYFLDSAPCG